MGLKEFLVSFEASLEEEGWDALPVVLAQMSEEGDEMVFVVEGSGDPYEILEEVDPAGVLAYVVSMESWSLPRDVADADPGCRPSEHPDRVEVRAMVAVTRSGETICVIRNRGEEPRFEELRQGQLVDAMTAALHATPG